MAASTESGSGDAGVIHPEVKWAQRKDKVFLSVYVEDCKEPKINLEDKSFSFSGKGGSKAQEYAVKLDLFGEVDVKESKQANLGRNWFFTFKKKDTEAPFWPRLTKEKQKLHFLKVDFSRWQDEDDSDTEEKEDHNLEEMMHSMGGMNGMPGMPGMGGMGGMGGMMGGMPGMGGMGGMQMPDMGGMPGMDGMPQPDSDDSDDEELPDLQ